MGDMGSGQSPTSRSSGRGQGHRSKRTSLCILFADRVGADHHGTPRLGARVGERAPNGSDVERDTRKRKGPMHRQMAHEGEGSHRGKI